MKTSPKSNPLKPTIPRQNLGNRALDNNAPHIALHYKWCHQQAEQSCAAMWNYTQQTGGMGHHKEIRMKGALVAGLVAMAFAAATSATTLAQANKDTSPGAVTSASKAAALPGGANGHAGGQASSAVTAPTAGVADTTANVKSSEKARN
jgi:hypothetical protein